MRLNKYLIRNFDWFVLTAMVVLCLIGIVTIFSATRPAGEGAQPDYYIKQALWLVFGLCVLAALVSFDYIWLGRAAYILYALGLFLLVLVHIAGKSGMGAQRWFALGPVSVQPSEFFKLFYVIALARHMSGIESPLTGGRILMAFLIFVAPALILLVSQPDLGTALITVALFISLTLSKGVRAKVVLLFLVLSLVSIPFLGNIFWSELRDYQKNRLIAFVEPEADPGGIGYHIIQSKVAIGSGGFFGKGYLKGTQGPLRFLPEKHTDFVFSVFAEEWGFIGGLLLIAVFFGLIYRGLDTARKAKDEFGRLLARAVAFMFATYTLINLSMTMGLMPVVGIPLPFVSYGGSALLANFAAGAILISIRARRFQLFY